jgi:predicted  nucleic acid-binding Zn-ribbon protein
MAAPVDYNALRKRVQELEQFGENLVVDYGQLQIQLHEAREELTRVREQLTAMTTLATEFANRCSGYEHPAVYAADMERIRKVGQ